MFVFAPCQVWLSGCSPSWFQPSVYQSRATGCSPSFLFRSAPPCKLSQALSSSRRAGISRTFGSRVRKSESLDSTGSTGNMVELLPRGDIYTRAGRARLSERAAPANRRAQADTTRQPESRLAPLRSASSTPPFALGCRGLRAVTLRSRRARRDAPYRRLAHLAG